MHEEGAWLPAFNEPYTSVRFFLLLTAALPAVAIVCISNGDKIHNRKERKKSSFCQFPWLAAAVSAVTMFITW